MIENPFDSPIPGQSLTDEPGNAKWEHPPQYTDVGEASEFVWEKMHDEKILDQIVSFLDNDIPVEAVARMVLFGGFMEGKWTPDVAILLSEIVFKQIVAIGMKAGVENMKLFLKDQGNTKFNKSFTEFKVGKNKAKESATSKNKAKEFAKELEKELKEKDNNGLMTKETD